MECKAQESEVGYTKQFDLYYPETYMYRCRYKYLPYCNQHHAITSQNKTTFNKILIVAINSMSHLLLLLFVCHEILLDPDSLN